MDHQPCPLKMSKKWSIHRNVVCLKSTNRENPCKRRCSNPNKSISWTRITKNYATQTLPKKPLPHAYFIFRDKNIFHFDEPRHEAHGTYNFLQHIKKHKDILWSVTPKKKNLIRLWSSTECQIKSIIHFIKIDDNYLRYDNPIKIPTSNFQWSLHVFSLTLIKLHHLRSQQTSNNPVLNVYNCVG